MRVINLFGGPGAGKSTTAAGVFREMKLLGYNAELITEYAKDMTWEQRYNILSDQLYLLAKQNRRQERLRGQVDYAITDSPLLLGLCYRPDNYLDSFDTFVMDVWNSYDNHSFFIHRVKPYVEVGRNETEEEARDVDSRIYTMLRSHDIPFSDMKGDESAVEKIVREIE